MKAPDHSVRLADIARERAFWVVLGLAGIFHCALGVWSLRQPENYLQGDRAIYRLAKIERLLDADSFIRALTEAGGPGDYVLHAVLWGAGGAPLVIAVQVLFSLLSVVALYWLGRAISIPAWAAAAATGAYVLFPNNVHHPHTLVTEAFFTPLVLIGFCFLARCLIEGRNSPTDITCFGLCATLASFIRPIFLALPPLLSVFLFANKNRAWRSFALANALALALPLASGVVQYQQTQRVELGGKGFGLQDNLFLRMERMAATGAEPLDAWLYEQREAGLWTYLGYAIDNPGPFLAVLGVDAVHMSLNTGVNHVAGRFFGWFDMTEDALYWRRVHDQKGFVGVVRELVRSGSTMVFLNAAALLLWLGLLALAGVGLVCQIRSPQRLPALCMLTLMAGFALASQSAMAVRFGLRSPMEFALAIFFGAGLAELRRRHASRRG